MEIIFMNTEKSKRSEPHKFVLNFNLNRIKLNLFPQRFDLKSSNKYVALQYRFFYDTQKNIRRQYKNNKLKIILPKWNDEFELPDGYYSVSHIQGYITYITKNTKHYQ